MLLLMSDVVIVSRDEFMNGSNPNVVRYGAILDDDAERASDNQTIEGMMDGATLSVDWRGIDQVDTVVGPPKRKPGRPKKVNVDG